MENTIIKNRISLLNNLIDTSIKLAKTFDNQNLILAINLLENITLDDLALLEYEKCLDVFRAIVLINYNVNIYNDYVDSRPDLNNLYNNIRNQLLKSKIYYYGENNI